MCIRDRDQGYEDGHRVVFKAPRVVDYRASVHDISDYLLRLMKDPQLRKTMGAAGRERVVKHYDYRVVAKKFVDIIRKRLEIT